MSLSNAFIPASTSLTSTGGSITFTASGNTIDVESNFVGLSWTDVTGTSQAAAANNGYTANNAGTVTFTLPATAAYGTVIKILGKGAGGWTITYGTGQAIVFGAVTTTTTSGSLSSSLAHDVVSLVCIVANTTFQVDYALGNLTYV